MTTPLVSYDFFLRMIMSQPCYSSFKSSKSVEKYKWEPSGMYAPFHTQDDFYFKREIRESKAPFNYVTDANKFLPLTNCAQYIPGIGQRNASVSSAMPMNVIDLNSDIRGQFRKQSLCPSTKYFPQQIQGPGAPGTFGANTRRNPRQLRESFNGGAPYLGTGDHFGDSHNKDNAFHSMVNCETCENCNFGLPCGCAHCKMNLGSGPGMNPKENAVGQCKNQIMAEETRAFSQKPCNLPGVFINRFEALCDNLQDPTTIDSNAKIGVDTRNIIKDAYSFPNLKKNSGRMALKKIK